MSALALAALLCAALDTLLTRLAVAHRPQDWTLPLQLLCAWAVYALIAAWPARVLGRRLRAPFSASLALLAGTIVVHHALAAQVRGGAGRGAQLLAVALALLAVTAGAALLVALERRAAGRRWPGLLLAAASLLLFPPLDALRSVPPPPAAPPGAARPNLLLLVWDTTRADHLQPWGYERAITPHLAALAERATTWDTAFSASVFTLSSHVSMLTGLSPALHGTTLRRQTVTAASVATALRQAGYRTGAFVGTSVLAAGHGLERGFEVYDDLVDPPLCDSNLWALIHDVQVVAASFVPALRCNGDPNRPQDFQRPARDVLASALAWIDRPDPRPWFAFINLYDAHWPYLPDKDATALWVRPYSGAMNGYLFRADDFPVGHKPDAADKAHVADLYDGELWELDRGVDDFLAHLPSGAGPTDLLLTADHGESLGEGDHWSHDELLLQDTHVPLLLLAPDRSPPGRRADPACGVDIAPTLLDLAGLPVPKEQPGAGRSLLAAPQPDRVLFESDFDNVIVAKDEHAALRGGLKLLRSDGRDTLHETLADPLNLADVAAAHPSELAALQKALDGLLSESVAAGAGGAVGNDQALRALGYVGN